MGTRTMGGSGNPKSDGLSKQGLMYNLTLDEVQNQLGDLGKPLTSMNLDELLKSVWTAESEPNQGPDPVNYPQHTQLPSTSSINPQSSLSKKTVDELWQDIQKKKDTNTNVERNKQPTLGEMTLEDFLAKAGIVAESEKKNSVTNSVTVVGPDSVTLPQQNVGTQQWVQYQIPQIPQAFMPGHHQVQVQQQPLPIQQHVSEYSDTQMAMSPLVGTASDTPTPGRKRMAAGDVMEKTVERRQKRMIKNRESAARSRARKQAYTHELENKVSRLEEENERLKREQEAENVLACVPPPEPKYQLRRTSSASF